LPDLRHKLDLWITEAMPGMLHMIGSMSPGAVYVPPTLQHLPAAEQARKLALAERNRVRAAELFYVTEEMTQLAVHAGRSMPNYTLDMEDLPAECGLLVWASSIGEADGGEFPVVAVSWGRHGQGVWLSYYCDHGDGLDAEAFFPGDPARQAELRRQNRSRLAYEREQVVPFAKEAVWHLDLRDGKAPEDAVAAIEINAADPTAVDRVEPMLRTVLATWLLMGQTIAAEHREVPDRNARRRLMRTPTPAVDVRTVTLRRPVRDETGDGDLVSVGGRVYTCQWVVRGHWRNQRYPSRNTTRPIWIAPHIAGPEGAPLKGGDRVGVLRR
jgi:hypothetical protein